MMLDHEVVFNVLTIYLKGVLNDYDAKSDNCTGTTWQHFGSGEGRSMRMKSKKRRIFGLHVVLFSALFMSFSNGNVQASQDNDWLKTDPTEISSFSSSDGNVTQTSDRLQSIPTAVIPSRNGYGPTIQTSNSLQPTPVGVIPLSIGDPRSIQSNYREQPSSGEVQSGSNRDTRTTLTIDSLTSTPAEILVAESTAVVFTAQIAADSTMVSDSVYLYQCDSTGNIIEKLGKLYDDETHGDSLSGDNIYSREVSLYAEDLGETYFYVTAAYQSSKGKKQSGRGSITGVESDLVVVEVIAASDPGVTDEIGTYTEEYTDTDFDAVDWTDATHSKSVDPNFDEVFDDTAVKRIDFVVTAERWQSMLDDMTYLYGDFGQNSIPGDVGIGEDLPAMGEDGPVAGEDMPAMGEEVPVDGEDVIGMGPDGPIDGEDGMALIDDVDDPIFVPADVFYNGIEWYRVGIRFKGNSSLQSSWSQGILKLSFKLDFDEFEDYYPQIDNQRFYGFKKFSLKNNYEDTSQVREKVAADVFANAGLVVSHTAFYALYIDHGDGPEYFGLYTLVEEVDGTVLDTQFSSDDGNLYKPEDGSASFVEGTFNADDFEKKTNEDDEDWSDIISLFSALHDDSRLSDSESWRENLESVFNVDLFLYYLAVNGIIQNWDSYGIMPHNFYLYNDPETSTLTWIPWDHNETLQEGNMGGALALDFSNIEAGAWPLIEKIYADATYKAKYDSYVAEVIENAFNTYNIQELYDTYAALVEPYATTEREGYSFLRDPGEFYQAIDVLKEHASTRATAVDVYLPE